MGTHMHWLLSVPNTFSLRDTLKRSARFVCPPCHITPTRDQIFRVERLQNGIVFGFDLTQAPAGLIVHTDRHLSGQAIEETSQRVWRMLRLQEDFQLFERIARHSPGLSSLGRVGARLLRGSTLFEDALIAVAAVQRYDGILDDEHVTGIVDRLGDPLPSNPTLHAFPTPQQVLDGASILRGMMPPEAVAEALQVATVFTKDRDAIEDLTQRQVAVAELEAELRHLLRLSPPAMARLMLAIGRYDFIPIDDIACRRLQDYLHTSDTVESEDIHRFFEPWQPWGGLAYWLWDWARVPASDELSLS